MKKFLKFLKWTAVLLFGIPLCAYLVWVAGNLKNDALSPEVARLLKRSAPQPAAPANAYFDTIGLAAPANMEPHAWGAAWFAQASANDRAALEDKPATAIALAGYPPGKQVELPCSHKDAKYGCLEEVAQDTAAAQALLEKESALLQRFDALLDKEYREPYRESSFWSDIPPRASESRAIRLAHIRFALDVAQGRDDAALDRWKRETAFILRQAKGSHTLIEAMICTASLARYQKLLAEYLAAHPEAGRVRTKQLLAMLEPFAASAFTLQAAFEDEAALSARSVLAPKFSTVSFADTDVLAGTRIAQVLATPLLDRHATANGIAAYQLEYARIATLQGDAYRDAIANMAERQLKMADEAETIHFRNPVGRTILATAIPNLSIYLYRKDCVVANNKLLAFAIDLLSRDAISPKQVAEALAARRTDLTHPYTGTAPNWDSDKRTLRYPSMEQGGSSYVPLAVKL